MQPLAILTSGMVTGVGLNAAATCAAVRCKINCFVETRFMDRGGKWIIGSPVPLAQPWRGRAKLVQLAASAIRECLASTAGVKPRQVPLLLCVAEEERPGRLDGLDDRLLREVQDVLGVDFHQRSAVIARGRVGGAVGVDMARQLIRDEDVPLCLVAGVDSLLVAGSLAAYEKANRLLTSKNSNGFIPGEAAGAVLVGPPDRGPDPKLLCVAIGFGTKKAMVGSEEPLRADGLVAAYRALRTDGGVSLDDADYRYTDCNGEQYGFKDDRLAISRTVRRLKARFDHETPVDCLGEVGAAIGPCVLGLALAAARKGYAPGRGVLCHFGNDEGDRAAMILRSS